MSMARSRSWRIILISMPLVLVIALSLTLLRQRAVSVDELSLGTSAARIKGKKGFSCLAQGQGGQKLQYAAKNADKQGGYYCVECEAGKVTAIYISYDKPVSRALGLTTAARLVGDTKPVETDSTELNTESTAAKEANKNLFLEPAEKDDELPRCEYIYYRNGNYAELQYSKLSGDEVSRIISYRAP